MGPAMPLLPDCGMLWHHSVTGAFPEWTNMAAPIINAAILVKEAPDMAQLEAVIEQLFKYER